MAISTITHAIQPLATQQNNVALVADTSTIRMRTGENLQRSLEKGIDTYRQNKEKKENEYLKIASVDPIFTMSTAIQERQAKMIDQYQKDIGDIYLKHGNMPPMQERLKAIQLGRALSLQQQSMLQDQNKAAQAYKSIEEDKDKNLLDHNFTRSKINDWIEGKIDKLDGELVKPSLVHMPTYMEDNMLPFQEQFINEKNKDTGEVKQVKKHIPMDKADMLKAELQKVYKDPRAIRTLNEEWGKLTLDEINGYIKRADEFNVEHNNTDQYKKTLGQELFLHEKLGGASFFKGNLGEDILTRSKPKSTTGIKLHLPELEVNAPKTTHIFKAGTYNEKTGDYRGKEIQQEADVWGQMQLPRTSGSVDISNGYIDAVSGNKKRGEAGKVLDLQDAQIFWYPILANGDIHKMSSTTEHGETRPGITLSPFLVSNIKGEYGEKVMIPYTNEVAETVSAFNPKYRKELFEATKNVTNKKGSLTREEYAKKYPDEYAKEYPRSNLAKPEKKSLIQKAKDKITGSKENKNEVKRLTKDGRTAIFDLNTKQFLRYE